MTFSPVDERLTLVPPNNLKILDEIDEREGFFGHVILNISWDVPQSNDNIHVILSTYYYIYFAILADYSYSDHYMITITTAAGFNMTKCGCKTWSGTVQLVSMHVYV